MSHIISNMYLNSIFITIFNLALSLRCKIGSYVTDSRECHPYENICVEVTGGVTGPSEITRGCGTTDKESNLRWKWKKITTAKELEGTIGKCFVKNVVHKIGDVVVYKEPFNRTICACGCSNNCNAELKKKTRCKLASKGLPEYPGNMIMFGL